MIAEPSHRYAPRWRRGLRAFHRDLTHHIRIFFDLYRSFLGDPLTLVDSESAKEACLVIDFRHDPRRDMSCSRLGWDIEQELLFYFWHKQRWDPNACIQYAQLHREHRYHPWVIESLFEWTDRGDKRRVLQLLGLRARQGRSIEQDIKEVIWRIFVREAVDELCTKGMSVRQATLRLAGQPPQEWPISQKLLTWAESYGHDILRSVGQKTLEEACYPRPTEGTWKAFCLVHHIYRGHLAATNSLPPFARAQTFWYHLLQRCREVYDLPVMRPPAPFDLANPLQPPAW